MRSGPPHGLSANSETGLGLSTRAAYPPPLTDDVGAAYPIKRRGDTRATSAIEEISLRRPFERM